MLVVVSPAKRLDMAPVSTPGATRPAFEAEASELAEIARRLSPGELMKLMGISEKLARLNFERFQAFGPNPAPEAEKPAIFAFAGDTYTGLDAATLDEHALDWAQSRLRILSGLYGLLRPLDLIQPYRLEMGSRLENPRGRTLYDYWGERIAEALNEDARTVGADTLVNCASVEYFSAVAPDALNLRVITPVFMEERGGQARIVSFFAKKARGAMARFMVENHLTDPESLKEFDAGGYRYMPDMSEGDRWVFLRDYPEG